MTQAPSPFLPGTNIRYAWDSTCLGAIKTCPRLYYYQYIEGWTSPQESIHLRFGQEYHSALEDYDRARAEGVKHEEAIEETLRALLERTYGWEVDEDTRVGNYKNRRTLVQIVIDYLDYFKDDPAKTYIMEDGRPAVELSFRFELDWGPNIDRTEMVGWPEKKWIVAKKDAQPYLLCGHLDRVVNFADNLYVMDRKTTYSTISTSYMHQWSPNNQMSLYTIAGQLVLGSPIKGVIIDAAQILLEKPNAFQRGMTYRTGEQLDEWLADLRSLLAQAEGYATEGYWPMNDTACGNYGGCKFREVCSKSPQVREKFLKTDFVQLPLEERWNPLRSRG